MSNVLASGYKRNVEDLFPILVFIHEYQQNHGFPPSYRDIAEQLPNLSQTASTNTVSVWLNDLSKAGLVSFEPNKSRTLRLTEDGLSIVAKVLGLTIEEELIMIGKEHPLTEDASRRILRRAIQIMRQSTEDRGDEAVMVNLDGNIDEIVNDIMKKRGRK